MILITGDTHGEFDDFLNRLYQADIKNGDTVVVCGDFGFVWDDPYHRHFLSKLMALPYTIAFADGNHEDFDLLETFQVVEWNGGKAHKISENIYHMMRGHIFTIEEKSFFVFGGAYSIDKAMRKEGYSWWPQELPDSSDYRTAGETLDLCGYKADYVITHTLPQYAIHLMGIVPDEHDAELTGYLEWLYGKLDFKTWFAGHFHENKLIRENIQVLYDEVIKL